MSIDTKQIESLESALAVATGYVLALASDDEWRQFQDDVKVWQIDMPKIEALAAQYKAPKCCTGNCNQGRDCPNREK